MEIETLVPLPAAAKHTSVSEANIRRRLKSGDIKGFKLGRDWVLPQEEVDRLAVEYPLVAEEAERG